MNTLCERSDQETRRRIENALCARSIPGWRAVRIEARDGTVVLSGKLPSDRAKWLCLECCRHIPHVLHVVDRLRTAGKNGSQVDALA